jgi:hypothetical protein
MPLLMEICWVAATKSPTSVVISWRPAAGQGQVVGDLPAELSEGGPAVGIDARVAADAGVAVGDQATAGRGLAQVEHALAGVEVLPLQVDAVVQADPFPLLHQHGLEAVVVGVLL